MRFFIPAKRHIDQSCQFIDFEAVRVGCKERDELPLCLAVALGLVGSNGSLKPACRLFTGLAGFFRRSYLLGTVKARTSRAPEKEQKRCRRPADPEIPAINTRQHRDHVDILLSLKGEDSYGAGCWSGLFGGFLPQPPYFSGGQRRGLTFGLSTHKSFGREDDRTNQREKKAARVTFLDGLTRQPYIPGLNAGALRP